MKLLVTGASGFVGRHLVKELSKRGYELRCLVRSGSQVDFLPKESFEKFVGDITCKDTLNGICDGVDVVIHTAALTNVKDVKKEGYLFDKINAEGTRNLLENCGGIKKFIHYSSVDAIGPVQNKILNEDSPRHPKHPYDYSKLKSEEYVKEYAKRFNFKYTILRPSMIYGEGESNPNMMKVDQAVLKFARMIKKHMFPIFGSGKNRLPFVHVSNVVQATILTLESDVSNNKAYIINDDTSYELNYFVDIVARYLNVRFPGPHIPLWIAKSAALVFEVISALTGLNLGITRSSIDYITANRLFDISKAKEELGYKPIDLQEGLKRTIAWYQSKNLL